MSDNAAIKILICQGTGGVSMGAKDVEAAFVKVIEEKGISAVVGKRCERRGALPGRRRKTVGRRSIAGR